MEKIEDKSKPIDLSNRKEIYPACCSHLFVEPENCYCCLVGCYNCTACRIDKLTKKEKREV